MPDTDPRPAGSRALRASVGFTALAAALLICGAAVEVTGSVAGSPADGTGGGVRPAPTARPRNSAKPLPHRPSPTAPNRPNGPTPSTPPKSTPTVTPTSTPTPIPTATPSAPPRYLRIPAAGGTCCSGH
jgi:hypothetical protein